MAAKQRCRFKFVALKTTIDQEWGRRNVATTCTARRFKASGFRLPEGRDAA